MYYINRYFKWLTKMALVFVKCIHMCDLMSDCYPNVFFTPYLLYGYICVPKQFVFRLFTRDHSIIKWVYVIDGNYTFRLLINILDGGRIIPQTANVVKVQHVSVYLTI